MIDMLDFVDNYNSNGEEEILLTDFLKTQSDSETNIYFKLGGKNCIAKVKTGLRHTDVIKLKPDCEKLHFFDPESTNAISH